MMIHRLKTVCAAAVALLYFCHVGLVSGEEIEFYGDDGSIFSVTLTGGCYTFKPSLDKKATAGEVDRGCFEVWDTPGCRGESRKLTKGSEGLRDFKKINFDKKISSVSLCSTGEHGTNSPQSPPSPITYPETDREYNKGPGGQRTLDAMSLQQVRDVAVAEHNKYRAKHGAPPLQGDASMNTEAQKYADYLASSNKFELDRNSRFIGNIASSFRKNPEDAIKDVVGRWYDGVNYYSWQNPGFSRQAGSFTAVVWKSTTHLGVGAAWNQFQNNWVIISYYSPSTNLQGAFRENVLPFSN